ncbi:MAG: HAMP domain-containing histidine kinase [Deltaproteobacteria bacterium]|nr:HAMP domain-containing histidine kinase [Deltaproteobacteria bacterium]
MSTSIDTGLRLGEIGAPIAVLDGAARVIAATPTATALITRFQLATALPASLPVELSRELASVPVGVPIIWRPRTELDAVLGCTRYDLGETGGLLLMREITEQQRALSQRLQRQRLEATGHLAGLMAHDLRTPLSSIVYNVDLLYTRAAELSPDSTRALLHETQLAADLMRRTIAGLLDFVRLGPPVTATPSLRETFDRVSSLLHPMFRAGGHELRTELHDERVRLRGNPLTIEQIFVDLLIHTTDLATGPLQMVVTSSPVPETWSGARPWRSSDDMVLVRLSCATAMASEAVADPTRGAQAAAANLELAIAREAAHALGGHLAVDATRDGCAITVVLPTARGEEGTS